MPIRHVGILAKRASTWPRDHFCRSMIAPRSLWPTKRVLADIDADHGDCALQLLGHGVLLVFGAPSQHPIAGGAGARPDHPISGHRRLRNQLRPRLGLSLRAAALTRWP